MIDEWDITATNLHRIRRRQYEVAVIPAAAIEAHNRHLPEGTDFIHTTYVARRSCELAWPQCQSVLCLPTIPFGVDCNQMAFPMAVHVSQSVLDAMLREIIGSLRKHGLRKMVILNGHGGNDFAPLVRQVQCDLDVHVFLCNWWTVGHDRYAEFFDRPDDHAVQFETSVMMALCGELVEPEAAGDGQTRRFCLEGLREGWVKTSRNFARLNDHCAAGDPRGASTQRGQAYLDLVTQRLSSFLVELAKTPIDEFFPHKK